MGIGWWLHDLLTSKKYVPPGSLILHPLDKPNLMHLVKTSAQSTTDTQWQFLHELSKKVFNFLKSKSKVDNKDNVIQWLKDKFSNSLENEDDKWENFKTLCEKQLQKEPKDNNLDWKYSVNVEESRLCFMGAKLDEKKEFLDFNVSDVSYYGNLGKWDPINEDSEYAPYPNLGFQELNKLNVDWWFDFLTKIKSDKVIDKFNEWYESSELKSKLN